MPTNPPLLLRPVSATKTALVFSWNPPETGTVPTSYAVRRDGGTAVDIGNVTTHTFTGLTSNTEYLVEVQAISADGPSEWVSETMSTVAFLREHFYKPVRNGEGALMVDSTVAVYRTGTTTPLTQPIYAEPTGDAVRGPAWLLEDGVVDFYVEVPEIVDLHIIVPGRVDPVVFPHQWVGDILDVDRVTDLTLAMIDAEPLTAFRTQQDARHAATYASKATQTTVEEGRLTKANLDTDYAAKSTQTTVETGRLSGASLDTAYKTPLDTHLADTSDAHDASAISIQPTGALAATDVQAALAELDTEKETPAGAQTKADNAATAAAAAAAASVEVVAATATEFGDATHTSNTASKVPGRPGFDTTGTRPVWASGAAATDTWVYSDGTVAFTPA